MEAPCGSRAHPGSWVFWLRGGFWFPQQLTGASPSRLCATWILAWFPALLLMELPSSVTAGASKPVKIHSGTGRDDSLSAAASQCCALTEDGGKRAEKGKTGGIEQL